MALALAARAHGNARGNPGGPNRPQPDFDWEAHCGRLNPEEFRRRYRLTPNGFWLLLENLWPKLCRHRKKRGKGASGGGKGAVQPHTMLAITLRFFAGASPLDLKLIYGINSRSTVYKVIWLTVDAINQTFKVDFPIQDTQFLAQKEAEFRAVSTARNAWVGQVGAVDGVHFKTSSPGVKVKDALKYYVARKAEYALLCIAVCDADRRFTFWDMSQLPTTHDSLAWAASSLGRQEREGLLPAPYFFNGDSAFTNREGMVTPSGGADDNFDYFQSSNRMCVECAFGILVRRFPVLWKPLEVAVRRRAPIISAIMRLHNFCIDQRMADEAVISGERTEIQPMSYRKAPLFNRDGAPVEYLHRPENPESCGPRVHHKKTATNSARRLQLMDEIKAHGYVRPVTGLENMPRRKTRNVPS